MDGQRPVLGSGHLIDVPAVTLDDFVANGGPAPQLVKIDVEVGEYDVLRGGDPDAVPDHPGRPVTPREHPI